MPSDNWPSLLSHGEHDLRSMEYDVGINPLWNGAAQSGLDVALEALTDTGAASASSWMTESNRQESFACSG